MTTAVVICAYSQERWFDLVTAVDSVRKQSRPADEIVVVIDQNPELLDRVQDEILGVRVVPNAGVRGLSGARNSGISATSAEIVAFLDDDAVAEPTWLEHLVAPFERRNVLAVGGAVEPVWEFGTPNWFPGEFLWVVGCSYRGLPEEQAEIRNVIGANMAFRRQVFEQIGGFRDGIGRIGSKPIGCEETELCIRARQYRPDGVVIHQPAALVRHNVPMHRARMRYFRQRCFAEGQSKALVAAFVGANAGLASERSYTLRTLPLGVFKGIADFGLGDLSGITRSAAIVAGFTVTACGYLSGRIATRRIAAAAARDARLPRSVPTTLGIKTPHAKEIA